MSSVQAIKSCFVNYTNFTGRASRTEYWYFILFVALAYTVSFVIDLTVTFQLGIKFPVATVAVALTCTLPLYAVLFRRLHDIGKSSWLAGVYSVIQMFAWGSIISSIVSEVSAGNPTDLSYTLGIVGFVGHLIGVLYGCVLFIFLVLPSKQEENKYGAVPEHVAHFLRLNQIRPAGQAQKNSFVADAPRSVAKPLPPGYGLANTLDLD